LSSLSDEVRQLRNTRITSSGEVVERFFLCLAAEKLQQKSDDGNGASQPYTPLERRRRMDIDKIPSIDLPSCDDFFSAIAAILACPAPDGWQKAPASRGVDLPPISVPVLMRVRVG
jgi:hypothetical protein